MINLEYKIARYEAIPAENPKTLVVRFQITDVDSGNFEFFEKTVAIDETVGKSQNKVCQEIYSSSRKEIRKIEESLAARNKNIVGSIFLPHD